jgi:hypothetical protein
MEVLAAMARATRGVRRKGKHRTMVPMAAVSIPTPATKKDSGTPPTGVCSKISTGRFKLMDSYLFEFFEFFLQNFILFSKFSNL